MDRLVVQRKIITNCKNASKVSNLNISNASLLFFFFFLLLCSTASLFLLADQKTEKLRHAKRNDRLKSSLRLTIRPGTWSVRVTSGERLYALHERCLPRRRDAFNARRFADTCANREPMRVELMISARNAWLIFVYSKHDIIK